MTSLRPQSADELTGSRRSHTPSVLTLSAALGVLALGLAVWGFPPLESPSATDLAVAALLVAGFALCESVVLHFEIGESAHSASPNELPLVFGLFLVGGPLIVIARILGSFLALKLYRRQSSSKIVFNLCSMSLEVVIAVLLFTALTASSGGSLLESWLIVLVSCLVSSTAGSTAVLGAISLSTGRLELGGLKSVLKTGTIAAIGNATVAFLAVDAVQSDAAAVLPVVLLGVGLALAYRSHVSLSRRHDRLSSLYGFVRSISVAGDGEGIVRSVLRQTQALLKAEVAVLTLVEEQDADRPLLVHYRLDGDTYTTRTAPATAADWPISRCLATGEPLLGQRSTRDRAVADHLDALGVRDGVLVAVPGDDGVAGTLFVGSRRGEHSTFDPADVTALEGVAGHAAIALRNGRLLDRLTHESRHDMLTGLPNRTEFEAQLTALLPKADSVAVLFMDLDRFKDVNDTLGHHAGDELLTQVAHRLLAAVAPQCTVARLGGDEFGVLLPGTTPRQALTIAHRLQRVLEQPVGVEGLSVDVGVSIGLAGAPDHGNAAGILMRRADIAMYDAKALNGVAVYDPARDDSSTSRLALVAQLRQALAHGEFVLHYQPQMAIDGAEVERFEALIRWPSATRGLVPPDEFIPVAERAGLLQGLTAWVLRRALDDVARWRAAGHQCGVAVNISPRNLLDAAFAADVRTALQARGLPASCLTLEVTEGSIMAERERAVDMLAQLQEVGVRISVDDFGTGYSSLSYLRELPVDEVKIDRSFVQRVATDDQDVAICRAVVSLAGSLGLTVVAEGVEDAESWTRLAALGCDSVQGFHISRPLPEPGVLLWLADRDAAGRTPAGVQRLAAAPRPVAVPRATG